MRFASSAVTLTMCEQSETLTSWGGGCSDDESQSFHDERQLADRQQKHTQAHTCVHRDTYIIMPHSHIRVTSTIVVADMP